MSKTGNWVLGMQEDAAWMSRDVFIRVHGLTNVNIWDREQQHQDGDYEPEPEEMGYYGA